MQILISWHAAWHRVCGAFGSVNFHCMTTHSFNALSQQKQRKLLLNKGTFLADRATDDCSVVLFHLEGLYVEVFFVREQDDIQWIRCLEDTDELDPYLPEIDLFHLLN